MVGNYSGTSVSASYNYWGQVPPVSSMFYGPVYWGNFMSSYYPFTHGHGGQAPSKLNNDNIPESNPMFSEDILQAYNEAENNLGKATSILEVRDELYALYQWAGISKDESLSARFNKFVKSAIEGQRNVYENQEFNSTFKNFAKILYGKSLIRSERYEEAETYLKQVDISGLEGFDKRDYLYLNIISETYHGKYEQALESLQNYYTYQESKGENMDEVRLDNAVLEEDLKSRMDESNARQMENQDEVALNQDDLSLQAYPNPFNLTTNITFNLPNKGTVSLAVYDMLGREVATLVNGELPPGEQTFRFDASSLANGMYLYELKTAHQVIVKKMTLIK